MLLCGVVQCLQVVIIADGQVTRNNEIVKPNVRKVRSMIDGTVIGGFAGVASVHLTRIPSLYAQKNVLQLLVAGTLKGHHALRHAGATADAFTLFERLEAQLETHPGADSLIGSDFALSGS